MTATAGRVTVPDKKIPVCPECGEELPLTDVGLEEKNGDTWADAGLCDNPECVRNIYKGRQNPKFYGEGLNT